MMKTIKNSGVWLCCLLTMQVLSQDYNTGRHTIPTPYASEMCGTLASYRLNGRVRTMDAYFFNQYTADLAEFKDSILARHQHQPGAFYHTKIYFDSLGREVRNLKITHGYGHELVYDSLGHLSKFCLLDGGWGYDELSGELIRYGEKYFTCNQEGAIQWYTYDKKVVGVITKAGVANIDSIIHTVDGKGNILKIESKIEGHKRSNHEFEYDSLNRIIRSRIVAHENGEIIVRWEFTYDETGDLVETHRYNEDGILLEGEKPENRDFYERREEYEYDNMGNWIKCKAYEDGKLTGVTLRDYQYY